MANKTVRNLLIAGGIGYILYLIFQRTIAKISYGAPTMRIHKVTGNGIEFRIFLPIINESDIPAPVSGFIGQVFYKGGSLGTVTLVQPVELPGFGQTTIEFKMESGLVGTAFELLNILTNGNPLNYKDIDYKNIDWSQFTIKGTLKVGKIPVDVNTKLLG